jgi:hypothetical protein
MLHRYLYLGFLILCTVYCMVRGGAPERIGMGIVIAATVLTAVALSPLAGRFRSLEEGVFMVDAAALLAFVGLALFANRLWPMFVAGLQGAAICIHLIKITAPDVLPFGYAIGLAIWGYIMLIALAYGTHQHRLRLTMRGVDNSWSSSSRRSHPIRPPAGPSD